MHAYKSNSEATRTQTYTSTDTRTYSLMDMKTYTDIETYTNTNMYKCAPHKHTHDHARMSGPFV